MALPEIVTQEAWLAARKDLLVKEKAATRARDALNTDRRNLPMVEVTKDYRFEGREGAGLSLLDLFAGRRQLVVVHFMFAPQWEEGCPSCSAAADERSPGLHDHLAERDTTLVTVARAPFAKLDAYRRRRGWEAPFYSSSGSDFNRNFAVSFDPGQETVDYNFRSFPAADLGPEGPGISCFLRDGDRVFHTYSSYARGTEQLSEAYYVLDLTALGRQEAWENPAGRGRREADPAAFDAAAPAR